VSRARVGFVGVGNMGLPMAQRLLEAGHEVAVRDIDSAREALAAAAGASIAPTPAALCDCDLVIVVVVDGAQTREVLLGANGLAAALPAGRCVMLCPTIAPADTGACAAALAARGIGCIDAPMSGGPERARDGTMSLMVACDDVLFERWQPLLRTLAARCFRVGTRAGDGARTKLVNNLLAAINLAGAAEVLALAGRLGLDPALTLSVIEQSSGQSWIGSDRLRRALDGDDRPRAHMALLAKDSALALDAARAAGPRLPVGEAAARHFAAALDAGLARADDSALWRWLATRD
jgi:L-threonate 2-dehydrogenase